MVKELMIIGFRVIFVGFEQGVVENMSFLAPTS